VRTGAGPRLEILFIFLQYQTVDKFHKPGNIKKQFVISYGCETWSVTLRGMVEKVYRIH
jgi:hypothetical protein